MIDSIIAALPYQFLQHSCCWIWWFCVTWTFSKSYGATNVGTCIIFSIYLPGIEDLSWRFRFIPKFYRFVGCVEGIVGWALIDSLHILWSLGQECIIRSDPQSWDRIAGGSFVVVSNIDLICGVPGSCSETTSNIPSNVKSLHCWYSLQLSHCHSNNKEEVDNRTAPHRKDFRYRS